MSYLGTSPPGPDPCINRLMRERDGSAYRQAGEWKPHSHSTAAKRNPSRNSSGVEPSVWDVLSLSETASFEENLAIEDVSRQV